MTVGIIENKSKKQTEFYSNKLREAFEARGCDVICTGSMDETADLYANADIIISLGGDGTFLRAASKVIERGTPVFGFNLGTLGFLTEFDKNSIDTTVDRITKGDYEIEERRVLAVNIQKKDKKEFFGYALNDCVVMRTMRQNMAYLQLYIRDIFVDSYPCDGIIVATQTGSTAYSLSAGGPIIEPGNDVVLTTPICSHSMGNKTIVSRPESPVKIVPYGRSKSMQVIVDGYRHGTVKPGEAVLCEECDRKVRIIRVDPPNFYTTVRTKLIAREN